MSFNIKNGLKMTRYHLKDKQMLLGFFICSLPAIALWDRFRFISALIYEISLFILIILIRCWDDPIKLGYEKAPKSYSSKS